VLHDGPAALLDDVAREALALLGRPTAAAQRAPHAAPEAPLAA